MIRPFALERFFAVHEFTAPHNLTSSDCEPLTLRDALSLADDEGLALWEGLRLGYTQYAGLPELRREVALLYEGIEPEDVYVAAPIECITLAVCAMLGEGDHVVCTRPGYQALHEVATALGCRVDAWDSDESAGWRFDVERLEALLRPETRAVIVNFPHNPTGGTLEPDGFEAALGLARERGAWFFSDEMYRGLELGGTARLPAACELYERAVSLSGMSKAYGMPGLRIGWLATRDRDLLERIASLRDYTTICSGAPSEVLAFIGLRAGTELVRRNVERLQGNLALLDAFFERHTERLGWVRPRAGTVAFPRILTGRPSPVFCADVLDRAGILLIPSTIFDFGEGHFRMGFGRADVPELLEAFSGYLEGA